MPLRTRKRKAVGEQTADAEEAATKRVAARVSRRTTAAKPKQQLAKASSNRQLIDVTSALEKRKLDFKYAKKQIENHGSEIIQFIKQQEKQVPPSSDRKYLSQEMSEDFIPILLRTGQSESELSSPCGNNKLQDDAMKTIRHIYSIVEDYEKLNKYDCGITSPAPMRWEQDSRDLIELNQHTMTAAVQLINRTIVAHADGAADGPSDQTGDLGRMAWELLGGREQQTEETWGTLAQTQARGFSKLLNLFHD